MKVCIGTAGWSIGKAADASFPGEGTGLQRYSAVLPVTEINSSFHRPHRASTWQRWHDSVPESFRFSVKVPKTITHQQKLVDCADLVSEFLAQAGTLGSKLAILLVQLPPKLAFDRGVASTFLEDLRGKSAARIVLEPRHLSWFDAAPDSLLSELKVARVAADPAICAAAAVPGGWHGLEYWRLHGSPAMYRSSYGDRIDAYADVLSRADPVPTERWCIFDNTASSAAISDALALQSALSGAARTD